MTGKGLNRVCDRVVTRSDRVTRFAIEFCMLITSNVCLYFYYTNTCLELQAFLFVTFFVKVVNQVEVPSCLGLTTRFYFSPR